MFTVEILPDEMRIPLDKYEVEGVVICECPGVVAVVQPLDLIVASKWNDAWPTDQGRSFAITTLVFDQLIRIEGLEMVDGSGAAIPFDKTNPVHRRSLPMRIRTAIYSALRNRAELTGEQEKN